MRRPSPSGCSCVRNRGSRLFVPPAPPDGAPVTHGAGASPSFSNPGGETSSSKHAGFAVSPRSRNPQKFLGLLPAHARSPVNRPFRSNSPIILNSPGPSPRRPSSRATSPPARALPYTCRKTACRRAVLALRGQIGADDSVFTNMDIPCKQAYLRLFDARAEFETADGVPEDRLPSVRPN